ncbi:Carboxylic ester hydrolase [Meloidogyne graminicola]|uniref:Carboxylic ester hydrolase n=1 Tax=Meloidogyne graminicola TaxID=189291 RepID=A0A8S9ZJ46_9BILA|nr:Carboxylic ester hydrolase [Meloidogyne graminicola]
MSSLIKLLFIIYLFNIIDLFSQAINCTTQKQNNSESTVIACTENGLVRGAKGLNFPNVITFKGIPYASPPIGPLRWKEPQPSLNWNGILNATNYSEKCAQTDYNELVSFVGKALINTSIGKTTNLSAVLVFIHGGAFSIGAAEMTDGEALANKGIIFVSIQYRLGPLGFLAHPALAKENPKIHGNYGLLDQLFAIKWVKNNIINFGGDPERITVGGHSAGAISAYMLANTPLSSNLFNAIICESGGIFYPGDPQKDRNWTDIYSIKEAENVGTLHFSSILGSNNVTAQQLRDLPVEKIFERKWFKTQGFLWHPVLDGYVFERPIKQTIEQGLQNQVYMLMGLNNDEFGASPLNNITLEQYKQNATITFGKLSDEYFQLYPASDDKSASEQTEYFWILNNNLFEGICLDKRQRAQTTIVNNELREHSNILQYLWAQLWLKTNKKSLYQYKWTHSLPNTESTLGSFHGAEISYFENSLYMFPQIKMNESEHNLADKMSSYIVNFVNNYNPNGNKLPIWTNQLEGQKTVMSIGNSFGPIPLAKSQQDKKIEFIQKVIENNN